MAQPPAPDNARYSDPDTASRIYFLPNLMTAGNLFCGYLAVISCIQANFAARAAVVSTAAEKLYERAVWLILLAVVFDALDGRMARMGGRESLFGKEFDSIADIISFGMAPALLVFFLILAPSEGFPFFRQLGWAIGFIYLLCAAMRLARFNVITHPLIAQRPSSPDFRGLPVPAAAGMIASLVPVLNHSDFPLLRAYAIFLPALLILIAILMISDIRYPSFKSIGLRTRLNFRLFVYLFCFLIIIVALQVLRFAVAAIFLLYIFYGLWRHFFPGSTAAPKDPGSGSDCLPSARA